VNAQKIEEFMHRIFPDSKDYEMSKSTIERQYKRMSEKCKDADIETLNKSDKTIKILGML
jgi:hypothetical protein